MSAAGNHHAGVVDEYFVCWWLLGVYDRETYQDAVLKLLPTFPQERLEKAMQQVAEHSRLGKAL